MNPRIFDKHFFTAKTPRALRPPEIPCLVLPFLAKFAAWRSKGLFDFYWDLSTGGFFFLALVQLVLHFQKAGLAKIPSVLVENAFAQDPLELAEIALLKNGFNGGCRHGVPPDSSCVEVTAAPLNICNGSPNHSLQYLESIRQKAFRARDQDIDSTKIPVHRSVRPVWQHFHRGSKRPSKRPGVAFA
jgi:hypothetical protein